MDHNGKCKNKSVGLNTLIDTVENAFIATFEIGFVKYFVNLPEIC